MHNRWAGGVVGVTPEGMGHHILYSVKLTLQEIFYFSAFLYQYIEYFVFLEVPRRGVQPPPPQFPLNLPLLLAC